MKVPVFRPYSYWALITFWVILIGLIVFGIWLDTILIWIIYWLLLLGLTLVRKRMVYWYRAGMALIKQEKFREAIPFFEKGYHYFKQNPRADKYRLILLANCSRMTYQEMALCNIAFCYSQLGEIEQAQEYYLKVMEYFPDNVVARTSLNVLTPLVKRIRNLEADSGVV